MNRELLLQIAGIAVVTGHTFPIFLDLKEERELLHH